MNRISKTSQVRAHVLDELESGNLCGGAKLPGARVLAEKLGISFLKVQAGLDTLMRDGVLYSVPRQGTFVRENWSDLLLQDVISLYMSSRRLPWFDGLKRFASEEGTGLQISPAFKNSIYEIRTSLHVQSNHEQYLDLSPFVSDVLGSDEFFQKPFEGFFIDGKLAGVPFLSSPRVITYSPELFRKAGCDMPYPGWGMDHLLDCIKKLAKIMPPQDVIFWYPAPFLWMNFVLRYGGSLASPGSGGEITIDSPEAIAGMKAFVSIYDAMGRPEIPKVGDFLEKFHRGRAAMYIQGRQSVCFFKETGYDGWDTVPLPLCDGGRDVTMQATELICVRKNCADREQAARAVKFMLSEKVQDHIGGISYAIPVRKSSAFGSINCEDPRDALFLSEMGKTVSDYRLDSPALSDMVENTISRLMFAGGDIEQGVRELAAAVRALIGMKNIEPVPAMK